MNHRTLLIWAVSAVLSAIPALAQTPRPETWDSVSDVIREHQWPDAINSLLEITRAMPADRFDETLVEPLGTFGDVVTHIANIQFIFCDQLLGNPTRGDGPTRGKEAVYQNLLTAVRTCDEVIDRVADPDLVEDRAKAADTTLTMIGHTIRETGRLVTYLRLAGVEPPELVFFRGPTWRTGPKG